MPNGIRKGVALHPHATIVGLSQPTYYDIEHQFNYFSATNTDWVRLWADWNSPGLCRTCTCGART